MRFRSHMPRSEIHIHRREESHAKTCHVDGTSHSHTVHGVGNGTATFPPSGRVSTVSFTSANLALNTIIELILYANTTGEYGLLRIDAFSCHKERQYWKHCFLPRTPESSCRELLIQRSVFLLAANHETHKVVFNLLLEDRRFSPLNRARAMPNYGGPEHICTKARERYVLSTAVSGVAGLMQQLHLRARTR